MRSLGSTTVTEEEIKEIIKEIDPEDEGTIDFAEFLSIMA
jgi:Ca2+-binding EF-hand superfamily protein